MKSTLSLRRALVLSALVPVLHIYSQGNRPKLSFVRTNPPAFLFMENKGQVADEKGLGQKNILFTAGSGGTRLYFTNTGIRYQFTKLESNDNNKPATPASSPIPGDLKKSTHRFSLELDSSNPHPEIETSSPNTYTENYYLTHCKSGITGVHGYEKIIYKNVYPQIDWVLYGKNGVMEYDFIVHPGGDPARIRLLIKDALSSTISSKGELVMKTKLGEVTEKAPVSFLDGKEVTSSFKIFDDGAIGFAVATKPGQELRIDPSVTWATYYGGNGGDYGYSTKADGSGNSYLAGYTFSSSGIASAGFQETTDGSADAFLVKFSSSGARLWATYYGGSENDAATSCAFDANGNVYLAGYSSSMGLASGGHQNAYAGNQDAFLVKFSSNGTRLWASYYGGTSFEEGNACTIDNSGNVYLAGVSSSPTGVASGGFQLSNYGNDAFLVKFNSNGSRLWATYYGGLNYDKANNCTTDTSGNVYLCGYTSSTSGIASGGFQPSYGGGTFDAFIVKFNPNGGRTWGTYFGGTDADYGYSCAIDLNNSIYFTGYTKSGSGIASGGFQGSLGASLKYDAFLLKLTSSGSREWSTYYGGSGNDYGRSCIVDSSNKVYVSGATESASGIASGGFQNSYGGGQDAFVAKFMQDGTRLWGSYYGGSAYDDNYSVCTDKGNNIFMAGFSMSSTGIAGGGFQNTISDGFDCFLTKIDGSAGEILPVTITSLTAYQQSTNILIEWNVLLESNLRAYEIEKSALGTMFSKTGEKKAANSNFYQWVDQHPAPGNNYYRIRSVDLDGSYKFSQVVKVTISKAKPAFELYPNPVTRNVINLSFVNQPAGRYRIQLLDPLLQVVLSKQITHHEGSGAQVVNLGDNMKVGTYMLQVSGPAGNNHTFKIIF